MWKQRCVLGRLLQYDRHVARDDEKKRDTQCSSIGGWAEGQSVQAMKDNLPVQRTRWRLGGRLVFWPAMTNGMLGVVAWYYTSQHIPRSGGSRDQDWFGENESILLSHLGGKQTSEARCWRSGNADVVMVVD